jgi:hypothetical protein
MGNVCVLCELETEVYMQFRRISVFEVLKGLFAFMLN